MNHLNGFIWGNALSTVSSQSSSFRLFLCDPLGGFLSASQPRLRGFPAKRANRPVLQDRSEVPTGICLCQPVSPGFPGIHKPVETGWRA